MTNNELYLIALSHFPKFGPKRLSLILGNTKDYEKAFFGAPKDLVTLGIEERFAQEFTRFRNLINLEQIKKIIRNENVEILNLDSIEYPSLLKEIHTPPAILFCRGEIEAFRGEGIAIVGTRRASLYGKSVTQRIVEELSSSSLRIVSGLALGIDAIAHEAALKAALPTIAVLGTGINNDSIYPRQNYYLARRIIDSGGLIISEFPFGTPGLAQNFPQRNRIISGLSKVIIVVEAAKKSGALITARTALEQNRDVMAVPGNINNKFAEGPNELLRQGATPFTKIQDLLELLNLDGKISCRKKTEISPDNEEERMILHLLRDNPVHVNELIRLTKLSTSVINSTLTLLEIKGAVKNIGNMCYSIID